VVFSGTARAQAREDLVVHSVIAGIDIFLLLYMGSPEETDIRAHPVPVLTRLGTGLACQKIRSLRGPLIADSLDVHPALRGELSNRQQVRARHLAPSTLPL
jgi:hypothetical protein